jgi:hypothetical protein
MRRRTVDRRPESILGAQQLTANDELCVSAVSLTDTPYDFRWYLSTGIPPSARSGAPCVSELYDSLADFALGKVSQNIPHWPEDAGIASKSRIESYSGIGTGRVGWHQKTSERRAESIVSDL